MIRRLVWQSVVTFFAAAATVTSIVLLFDYGLLTLIIAAPIVYLMFKGQRRASISMGSARIAGYVDLILSGLVFNKSGVLLGKTGNLTPPTFKQCLVALFSLPISHSKEAMSIFHVDRRKDQTLRLPESLGMHVAYIAPTGQGKSAGYAIPNLLTDPNSAVVLDFKGELLRETAYARMRQFNQRVVCFAPFGLPKGIEFPVDTFNPLHLIDPASNFYLDHASSIAKSLIVRESNEHQPFFNDAAEMLITSFLAVLITEGEAKDCTLGELRNILSLPHIMDKVTQYMMENAKRYPAQMEQLAGPVMSLQGDARFNVISTINSHLRWLDSVPVAQSLTKSSFDPAGLFDKRGMTIYIHIPVQFLHAYRGLTRVIFSSLINFIFQQGESKHRRIRFYLDESHGLGSKLDSLYSALVYGRSFGINLNFFFQALSQVDEVFDGSRGRDFLSNIVPVFTGIRDLQTAQAVSSWIGRQTIEAASWQNGLNSSLSESFQDRGGRSMSQSYGHSSSRSYQEQTRELLMPEEILQLPERTSIITVPHLPPIIARPSFYFEDKKLSRLAEQSRRYATPRTTSAK